MNMMCIFFAVEINEKRAVFLRQIFCLTLTAHKGRYKLPTI